eukprot:GHRR01000381.1.p1 GENE.GHRR01000381.1~~GHRR01000381.1.p1  ORF type:complete len:320 (+),score=71.04 GHRR01000381.1:220-1179(+)
MAFSLCSTRLPPVLPILLGLGAIICTGIWHHYSTLALQDTRVIAALISLPLPSIFASTVPKLLAASIALVVIITVLTWSIYAWRWWLRSSTIPLTEQPGKHLRPLAILVGIVNTFLYVLLIWFVVMFAISILWLVAGLVAAKATMDGANALVVVDETMPRLIQAATPGIDPAKDGYLVHVAGRDVNIGQSSCSLFCFTLARALMADTIDCTCDQALAEQLLPAGNITHDITDAETCGGSPVMCSINAYAFTLFDSHMKPAVVAAILTVLFVAGLLALVSGTFARVLTEQNQGYMSRSSSADATMKVESVGVSHKGDAPV